MKIVIVMFINMFIIMFIIIIIIISVIIIFILIKFNQGGTGKRKKSRIKKRKDKKEGYINWQRREQSVDADMSRATERANWEQHNRQRVRS